MSWRHASFLARGGGASATIEVRDEASLNGVGVRGRRIAGRAELEPGDTVRLGESVLQVEAVSPVAADLTEVPDTAELAFNRPPHIAEPRERPVLVAPGRPEPPGGFRFPWIAALTPLLLGIAIYLVMPQYGGYLVLMMLMSPVMLAANALGDRRGDRHQHADKMKEYYAATTRYHSDLAALAREDERHSRLASPGPAEVIRRAAASDARLWPRRRDEPDFLRLRLGLMDRPADITLRNQSSDQPDPSPPEVRDVPACVDVRAAGVVGVAGPRDHVLGATRALLTQAAALHAPGDLAMAVITGADTAGDWDWASWLPHVRPWSSAFPCRRLFATDGHQAAVRLAELSRVIEERGAEQRALLAAGPPPGRAVLVVLDGARRLRSVPGLAQLLATGPATGVYALCLDSEETALPDECGATMVLCADGPTRATLRGAGRAPVEDVLVDGVDLEGAELVARSLAPLRVLGDDREGRELPERARFGEMFGITPNADSVLHRWAASPAGRSARAPIGVAADHPVVVDLLKDGPHALIAGTSGSGKSELLQTLVASLALVNMPDALNFVLVDYKGGSAFAACSELPHCAGLITDLDGRLVRRALDSLSAELRRREALLAEAGAKDIADYWARTGARLPRLVIVVDEFASLIEEVPDFIPGIVGIGMRGRSLGVHVVLATQRPGGVVSADLRANLNLRICLRVTSDAESGDVIDSPVAARIAARQAGRGYLRTGHSQLTQFQVARVGCPLPPPGDRSPAAGGPEAVTFTDRTTETLGMTTEPTGVVDVDEHGRTDLSELVAAIRDASEQIGLGEPARPWLPPLPDEIALGALDGSGGVDGSGDRQGYRGLAGAGAGGRDEPSGSPAAAAMGCDEPSGSPAAAAIGLVDRPAEQAQVRFRLDLDHTGPVLIAGAVRTGRSTALRTIAGALATAASPADLHLYGLDCGNHALAALEALPHCGAVVDGADEARTERLLAMLNAEVGRRQRQLANGGYGSLAERRAAAPTAGERAAAPTAGERAAAPTADQPAERRAEAQTAAERRAAAPTADQRAAATIAAQRAGATTADQPAHIVVLVDRLESFVARYAEVNGGALLDRLESLLRTGPAVGITVVLATDRTGLTHRISAAVAARLVLRQSTADDMVFFGVDHRTVPAWMPPGRAIWTSTGEEMQIAVVGTDPSGGGQMASLGRLADDLNRRWDGLPEPRLPRRIDPLPDEVDAAQVDALRRGPRPPGRSVVTVGVGGDHLAPVDIDLAGSGGSFVVAGPPGSGRSTALLAMARSLDPSLPVVVVAPRPTPLRDLDAAVISRDVDRQLDQRLAGHQPLALIVDDAELVEDLEATEILERYVRRLRDSGSVLLAAATTEDLLLNRFRGWLAAARRDRCGLLLNPATHLDGEVFDLRLPRSIAGGWPPGTGPAGALSDGDDRAGRQAGRSGAIDIADVGFGAAGRGYLTSMTSALQAAAPADRSSGRGGPMIELNPEQRRAEQQATLATPPRPYGIEAKVVFWLEDRVWGTARTLSKFKAQELVARSPYRAWIHDHIDDGCATEEEQNEKAHWTVLQALIEEDGTRDSTLRFGVLPLLGALGTFAFTAVMDRVSASRSYRFNVDIEDHAEHEYASLVAEHPEWDAMRYDASPVPEYGTYLSRADVLRQIGSDEGVHKQLSLERAADD